MKSVCIIAGNSNPPVVFHHRLAVLYILNITKQQERNWMKLKICESFLRDYIGMPVEALVGVLR